MFKMDVAVGIGKWVGLLYVQNERGEFTQNSDVLSGRHVKDIRKQLAQDPGPWLYSLGTHVAFQIMLIKMAGFVFGGISRSSEATLYGGGQTFGWTNFDRFQLYQILFLNFGCVPPKPPPPMKARGHCKHRG